MFGLLIFIVPAAWLAYLLGRVIRVGLAATFFYPLADIVPWILSHWNGLVQTALALGLLGNMLITRHIKWGKWQRNLWAYPLALSGGTLWLLVCLINPDWWAAPFNGLVGFTTMLTMPLAATVAHFAMKEDEITEVLGVVALALVAVAALHVIWMALGVP